MTSVAHFFSGWILLDVTHALKTWQLDYHTNQGLMVEIVRKNREIQLHPVAIGLATNREDEAARVDKEVRKEEFDIDTLFRTEVGRK